MKHYFSYTEIQNMSYFDFKLYVEALSNKEAEQIKQGNVERITQVANDNANRDTQANKEWANAYLNAMQYNNDIENQKLAGIAQAQANALTGNAQIAASTSQANAQGWGSAIANSAKGFGDAIELSLKTAADRRNVLIGADAEQQYRAAMLDGSRSEAQSLYNSWKNGTKEQKQWAANLDEKWNGKLSGKLKQSKKPNTTNTVYSPTYQQAASMVTNPLERRLLTSLANAKQQSLATTPSMPTNPLQQSFVINPKFDFSNLWLPY